MGDEVRSIGVKAQNNKMRMKIISYNAARMASSLFFAQRVSAGPPWRTCLPRAGFRTEGSNPPIELD